MSKFENKTLQGKLSNFVNPLLNRLGLIIMPYHKVDQTKDILEYLVNELATNKKEPEYQWSYPAGEVRGD